MAYLDGMLMGFVVGLAAGIFLAYKIALHAKNKPRQQVDVKYSGDVGSGYPEVLEPVERKRLR